MEKQFEAVKAQMLGTSGDVGHSDADNGYGSEDDDLPAVKPASGTSSAQAGQTVSSTPSVSAPVTTNKAQAAGTAATGQADTNDPAGYIASRLQSELGLDKNQAAGVLGNLKLESGLVADINQGGARGAPSANNADDNQNGYGLVQWGGSRKEGLLAYAKQSGGSASDLKTQVDYMMQELKGSYSGTVDALKQAKTPQETALAFCTNYEKASEPNMASRNQYAEEFARQLA